ncbi:MAG TPA: hypothetical protein VFW88_06985 [Burkholderiales bacterium]|nr:hypothetical protein [Burkholderiales bacterium]
MAQLPVKHTAAAFSLTPSTLQEALQLAEIMAKSTMVPKPYQGNAGNVLVAVQMGAELGLSPMQAVQNIAVINGNPAVWGDAIPALVQVHPKYEWMKESWDERALVATCIIKRKGEEPHTVTFGQADAQKAGLTDKDTYKHYLRRMCQMRARAWAARDKFADALKGLKVAEEVQDYEERNVTPRAPDDPPKPAELPLYADADLQKNLPQWRKVVEGHKKTPDDIIATIESKYQLSDAQKTTIRNLAPIEGETT